MKFQNHEIDESDEEIAFAKADLAIAAAGNGANLKEDRKLGGGTESTPHEMDPGGVVFVPMKDANGQVTAPGKRAKLTITGNGSNFTEGNYTLTSDSSLTKIKIYTAETGGSLITLPKTYTASDLSNPKTLYVGADAFESSDPSQNGKLTLKYELSLQTGPQTFDIKDEIKAILLPVDIKAYRPEMVQQSIDLRPADQSKLVIPYADTVNPRVRIRVNHDDDDDEPNGRPYEPDGNEDSVTGENDLIKVEFACPIPNGSGIKVFLKRNSAKLRVWESKEKGGAILKEEDEKELTLDAQQKKTLWVEATDEGGGELEWELRSNTAIIGTASKLKFITYTSLLVGVSGETFGAAGAAAGNGVFNVCQKLYLDGYNIAYYDVNGIDPVTDNPAKREARLQITSCNVVDLGVFGHSHGGGSTYGISKGLNNIRPIIGNFNLKFTGYIDAIEHDDGTSDPFAETRLPPSTAHHWNYYQRRLYPPLRGNSVVGAAVNLDVNGTAWGAALNHVTIDNDGTVQDHLYSEIRSHVTP